MNLPPILTERCDEGALILDLALSADLDVFRGHFPDLPILPGVVQIDWAFRLAKDHGVIGAQAELRDFQVKFRNVIRPPVTLSLSLRWDAAKKRVFFDYRSGETLMSSGRLIVRTEPS
jgi:3-hydroxymyristoyl/3-hydroxydecanoyl-(acyl carrier protein) dehydratase